ncbi:alpha/beta hydrolase-fold protein [Nakamurella alba]|uniref:alpha/beta hydrolase-fold protein n=1 Tax=Nakamurella alba TaxID=2665158 RepID=UPI002AC36B96|nr:alpha/beta hydrolase-fold protein [Nakamurella alba]
MIPGPGGHGDRDVVVHGHWGRPVIWFPAETGDAWEFERNGMLDAVRPAVDEGRITVFCVSAWNAQSWSARWKSQHDRALAHLDYEGWLTGGVLPFVRDRCGGRDDVALAGPSMGAFQAVLLGLRQAHLFHRVIAFSGGYDPWQWHAWGEGSAETYLTNPSDFLRHVGGEHLEHLRRSLQLTLVVGSGQWEDTTGALASTRSLAAVLADKGIPHDLHVWGPEWPHDWVSWRAQAAVYLPQLG